MKRNNKIYAFMVILLGIAMMFYSGGQLIAADQSYQEANVVYENLNSQVKKNVTIGLTDSQKIINIPQGNIKSPQIEETAEENKKKLQIDIPPFEIDFDLLKTINKDAVVWLYSPGTLIDYPVMKADDYSYYLNHLPNGTKNSGGSLFIDYNCASDFSDPLTVVYGHHMKSGSMFGSLLEYKNQKYYEEHPYMYLYTEHGNYRIDIIYGCVIAAGQWRERAFMCVDNLQALLAYAEYNTTFESNITYEEGDKIIAMSTCSYEFNDARYLVIGILRSQ